MATIETRIGTFTVSDGLSLNARQAIIESINQTGSLQIVLKHQLSVPGPSNIPTSWDVVIRVDLASPRGGNHGGIQCPHAQINEAFRHGGFIQKFAVAHDRGSGGTSLTKPSVNLDRIGGLSKAKPNEVQTTRALNDVEVTQVCRGGLPHGLLLWLQEFCQSKTT